MLISLLEVRQEGEGVIKGRTWRTLRVPDQRHGGKVIHDVKDVLGRSQGLYPERFGSHWWPSSSLIVSSGSLGKFLSQ